MRLERRPISLVVGTGADHLHRVRAELSGEPVRVIQWHREPTRYIADALGLSFVPPMLLQDAARVRTSRSARSPIAAHEAGRPVNMLLAGASG